MEFFDFNTAVGVLDEHLQSKTTHSTYTLLTEMQKICNGHKWHNAEDQQDFANICSNFDKWVRATGKTSIGRKQFEALWEKDFQEIDLQVDPLPRFTAEDAADELGSYFSTVDNSKDAHSLKVENTRLKNENRELRKKVEEFERKLAEIRRMLTWG